MARYYFLVPGFFINFPAKFKRLVMAIINENELRRDSLVSIAKKMIIAARTAPKAKGVNNMAMSILTGSDIQLLAKKMKEMGEKQQNEIFTRDANNIRASADVVLIMGSKIQSLGLKLCGICGYKNCEEKNEHPEVPCAFNTGDLGIAIGSAVSVAMDYRVDNRIMYTIGMAAKELELLGKDFKIIYGIPLSATSKNPFFDRK